MTTKSDMSKKYSDLDLEKIRKRAREIWKRKCDSFKTALDDWLQAERELKTTTDIKHKRADQYTGDEVAEIKKRAELIREEKIKTLRTTFDDWIEAEQELKEELKKKIDIHDLFDIWFKRSSSGVAELLKTDGTLQTGAFHDVLEDQYVDLMAECMT